MKETQILKTAGKDHFLKDEKEKFKLVLCTTKLWMQRLFIFQKIFSETVICILQKVTFREITSHFWLTKTSWITPRVTLLSNNEVIPREPPPHLHCRQTESVLNKNTYCPGLSELTLWNVMPGTSSTLSRGTGIMRNKLNLHITPALPWSCAVLGSHYLPY